MERRKYTLYNQIGWLEEKKEWKDLDVFGMILSIVDFKSSVGFLKNDTTCQMKIAEDFRDDETHTYRYVCSLYAQKEDSEPAATAKITVMETENMTGMFSQKEQG